MRAAGSGSAPPMPVWTFSTPPRAASNICVATMASGSLSSDRVYDLSPGPVRRGLDRHRSGPRSLERAHEYARAVRAERSGRRQRARRSKRCGVGGYVRCRRDPISRPTGIVLETFFHDPARPTSIASNEVRAHARRQLRAHRGSARRMGSICSTGTIGELSHYRYEPGDADSLRASYVMSLHQDAAGLLWIGTRGGGVSRWNPRSWELGSRRPAWLGSDTVQAFADAWGRRRVDRVARRRAHALQHRYRRERNPSTRSPASAMRCGIRASCRCDGIAAATCGSGR